MNSPHIAMYIGSLQKGGAERVMVNLAEYFFSLGWKVTFVTTYLGENEYEVKDAAWKVTEGDALLDSGAKAQGSAETVYLVDNKGTALVDPHGGQEGGIARRFSALLPSEETGSRAGAFTARVRKLRGIFKELKPDLILSFSGKNNLMAILSSRGLGIPVVVSCRSDPAREYAGRAMKSAMRLLFPMAAGTVLQTKDAAEFFPESVKKKAVILPNSLNRDFISREIVRERQKTIISVGRLDDNKNQALILKAFASLAEKDGKDAGESGGGLGLTDGWSVILYGDGPSRDKLKSLSSELGIADRVFFPGAVSDVADRTADAGIFVLSSIQEGMPNALLEAMALGTACISTDCPCGGPRDLIQDKVNGLLVPSGDVPAMAKAMETLMRDPEAGRKMGDNAARVRKTHHPDEVNLRWKSYLEKVMRR